MERADGGTALVRRAEIQMWIGQIAANVLSALLLIPSVWFIGPALLGDVPLDDFLVTNVLIGTPYLVAGGITGRYLVVRPHLRRATRWIIEGRAPTEDERIRVATQPRRQATSLLGYWVVYVGILIPLNLLWFDLGPIAILKTTFGLCFLAFIGWALSYLLVERAVRPLLALALASSPTSEPRTMGIFARLTVAWGVAGGFPLTAIAVVLLGFDTTQRASSIGWVYFMCAASLVSGIVATVIAARAITDPISKVRAGLSAIEDGVFDVQVPVDEGSEIGVLQMGFNRMAHGLRERERMRDIFGRHVGAEVAARALSQDLGLSGERREATALFVDVIASTAMTQREDPDDVVAKLNSLLDAVVRCISAEGGLISKFLGDGALCIFGAPNDQSDHAARALRAARCLAAQIAEIDGVDAAIGISSGEVVAGNVGTADRYEYTVLGDAVNEASRLTDLAKALPSHVLVSDATVRAALDEATRWRECGSFHLRGRSEPTVAYEPIRAV